MPAGPSSSLIKTEVVISPINTLDSRLELRFLLLQQVKRIDYYQRTDQALSQFLSGASAHSLSTDVTTYLHGDGLLTLRVARLPEGQELPGADTDQVWFWLRPRQVRQGAPHMCHRSYYNALVLTSKLELSSPGFRTAKNDSLMPSACDKRAPGKVFKAGHVLLYWGVTHGYVYVS